MSSEKIFTIDTTKATLNKVTGEMLNDFGFVSKGEQDKAVDLQIKLVAVYLAEKDGAVKTDLYKVNAEQVENLLSDAKYLSTLEEASAMVNSGKGVPREVPLLGKLLEASVPHAIKDALLAAQAGVRITAAAEHASV